MGDDYYIFQIGTTWDIYPASQVQAEWDSGTLNQFTYIPTGNAIADIDRAWTCTGIGQAVAGVNALADSQTYGGITLIYTAP